MNKFLLSSTVLLLVSLIINAQSSFNKENSMLFPQERTITGTVLSAEDDSPLPGVSVVAKAIAGSTAPPVGTVTDIEGKYSLSVPDETTELEFRFIGFITQTVEIGARSIVDVSLAPDSKTLEEVVVTAAGIERDKRKLGYAIQEVKSDEILRSQETNIGNALNAKVAGVQVISNSGAPGAGTQIRVRGNSSIIGNNSPLFVIDGVPIDNSTTGGSGGGDGGTDGVANSNRAIDINPEDIASITVLKGGGATALYGIRAANGAIIINTKKGSLGEKTKFSFSTSLTANEMNGLTPLQDQYSQGWNATYGYPSTSFFPSAVSWGAPIANLVWVPSMENKWDKNGAVMTRTEAQAANLSSRPVTAYDNLDDFYKVGLQQNYYLSASGGTQKATFFISGGYLKNEGTVPNSQFERYTGKANADFRFTEKLKLSSGVTYTFSEGFRIQRGSNISGVNLGLLRTPPTFDNSNGYGSDATDNPDSYLFPDGSQRSYRAGGGYDNPFWIVNRIPHNDQTSRMIGYLQLNYAITDWLDVMGRLGNDFYNDRKSQNFAIGSRSFPAGQSWERNIYNQDFNTDIIFTATRQITTDLEATLIAGYNYFRSYTQDIYIQGDGFALPAHFNLSNASNYTITDGGDQLLRRHGVYFDLTLAYKDLIFLDVTGRNDWSSTLPENDNALFYPSVNLGFAFSELINTDIISYAKLRGSYAVVGNDALLYSTATYFQSASADGTVNAIGDGWTNGLGFPGFGGTTGFTLQTTAGNPNIEPEKSITTEIGLDIRFLDNRISLDVALFDQRTQDQILPVDISGASGFRRTILNAGEVSSKGLEFVLTAVPVQLPNFKWEFTTNFTTIENKVEELAPGLENIFLGGFTGTGSYAAAGEPFGIIYGGTWARDDQGRVIIGEDGYPEASGQTEAIGDPNPDWTAGIRNTLSYKNLTFSFLFDIRQGGDIWNGTKGALTFFGASQLTADNRDRVAVFDGVLADGSVNTKEVALDENWYTGNGGGFGAVDEQFVEDASWIRLRDINLSYRLPKNWFDNLFIKNATFSVSARNLWVWTAYDDDEGIDPETSLTGGAGNGTSKNALGLDYFNFPNTRSYSATLRFNF